ncbi:GNAT family N-acetyltransferase [Haladaptatus caseinilyticus]|uniref:GNAT family N-acetyltransferase n=1 Tax=Haladaptatus caseinilyticus TaxID=2993314 RepID=UPI00224A56DD|nr:GNAT family N-acetyltransferase [Haladaptatus caseinilyticus]
MTAEFRQLTDYDSIRVGIDCWNRTYPSFAIPGRVAVQNVFAPFTGVDVTAWGGFEDNTLVAFALGKRLTTSIPEYTGSEQGWISLFAVDPAVENRTNVSQKLLATVERDMTDFGVSRLRFGGDPGHFLPGVPTELDDLRKTLRQNGFGIDRTFHDLRGTLTEYESPPRIADVADSWPELALERVGADAKPLLEFLSDQFPGRWSYEAENFVRVPGGASEYWLLRNEGETVGFARTNTPNSAYRGGNVNWADRLDGTVCGLGPLGVHESYRGRGWGLWLVASLTERYRDAGYDHMIIDWTDLAEYYGKLGFEPWLTYETVTKELRATKGAA